MFGAIGLIALASIISLIVALTVTLVHKDAVTSAPTGDAKAQFSKAKTLYEVKGGVNGGQRLRRNFDFHHEPKMEFRVEEPIRNVQKRGSPRVRDLNKIFELAMNGRVEEMALNVLPIHRPHGVQVEMVNELPGEQFEVIYRAFYKLPCDCSEKRLEDLIVILAQIEILTNDGKRDVLNSLKSDILEEDDDPWEQEYGICKE
ncbi:hypothetical protein ACOME3_001288 [Neoechinorhynchus agilis]